MDKNAVEKVCKQIYRRIPTFKDAVPKISRQGEGRYLLIYSHAKETADGKKIQQIIRVVASQDGRIIKTSMSR